MESTTFNLDTTQMRSSDRSGADRPARDVSVADFAWVTRRIFENQLVVGRRSPATQ
jgi:hypothetical protein